MIEERAELRRDIAFAEDVEAADIVTPAVARKTTARTQRNSLLVGAVLGLILGIVAALAWDAVAPRFSRRPAL